MDADLKRDLKGVKEDIKKGISQVIEDLKVNDLGENVKTDLKSLKGKISGLKNDMEKNGGKNHPLVKEALEKLAEQKRTLDDFAGEKGKIITETGLLETKFEHNIQKPLSEKVDNVDQAIGTLGRTFDKIQDGKSITGIFVHIKTQVAAIKGNKGNGDWQNTGGSGLDGITSKVEDYFNAFGRGKFEGIVAGWLDNMVEHNGVVQRILMALGWNEKRGDFTEGAQNVQNRLSWNIRETQNLKKEIPSDGASLSSVGGNGGNFTKRITAVKKACEAFSGALDGKLKEPGNEIVNDVKGVSGLLKTSGVRDPKCICDCYKCGSYYCNKEECAKKAASELILCALTAVARQVGNELNSVFLNIADKPPNAEPSDGSIAKILDTITPIVDGLNKALTDATNPPSTRGSSDQDSPAQAVDKRLQEVRDEVSGLESKFTKVTEDLTKAVKELPGAVERFDTEAQEQIKAAAGRPLYF
ncbi:Extracellular matrix-binding ebh, putative [Babesia ovata]|uniref:Extracellular matrix-binding ebh, putative n=1 Tax=Babesia ovata TaxID=189622 RepID=A0A2H6KAT6_9APIC|nr:Extracellular matrix-binding ebh, putative [Babesia ovata]GBE60095.1 Extracellular matrix-binding ebh, putative [Babesia ovata]